MLKAALSAGVVAVLAVMLLISRAPQSAEAATLFVFNPSDSGFGTLRWAVDQANGNSSIDRIVVKTTVPITLYDPVVYTGSQALVVQGDHALLYRVIQGGIDFTSIQQNGFCGLFESVGGADITFYQLVFRDSWCDGIVVLSDGYDGEVVVTLNKVIVENNDGKGVYIAEEVNGGGVAIPTATSFKVVVTNSFIQNNGQCDEYCKYDHGAGDGLVVDEADDGGITATCTGSTFSGNHGDGLELHEWGSGNVAFTATNCQFNNNEDQEFNPDSASIAGDGEAEAGAAVDNESFDGLHIVEYDNGDVTVTLNSPIVANGNMDDGINAAEYNDGKITFTATGVTADGNDNEGVDVYEDGAGNATVKLTNVKTWYNGNGDSDDDNGVEVDEDGDGGSGDLSLDVTGSSANFNDNDGYDIEEYDGGKLTAKFQTVVANANGDDGFDLEERDAGAFTTTIYGSTAQGNSDDAVDAEADDVGDGMGTIAFGTSTLIGNIELDNVNVIP